MRPTIREFRRRRGLEPALLMACLNCFFHGQQCFLSEEPQDALRAVGQSVTFTCNSSWTKPIRWSHRYLDDTGKLHVNQIEIESSDVADSIFSSENGVTVTGRKGSGSPDGYWSMLKIANVSKIHQGTYSCVDGTCSRGFARLTVLGTSGVVCLTVSPRDQVVEAGDGVVLTASSSSTRLRYYYESLENSMQSPQRFELYDGKKLNDCYVDERYSVIGVGDKGHADLVIRSVQPQDAGRYIVRDMNEVAFEVAADLVVFDLSPSCTEVWNTSAGLVELRCQARYTGQIKPTVSFGDDDVTDQCLQPTPPGNTIDCSLTPCNDKMAAALSFVLTFQLSRCGELDSNWTWMHTISLENGGIGYQSSEVQEAFAAEPTMAEGLNDTTIISSTSTIGQDEHSAVQLCIISKSSLPVLIVVSAVINIMVCVGVIMGYALCKRCLPCCRSEAFVDPKKVFPSDGYDQLHKVAIQPVLPSPTTKYEEVDVGLGDYEEVPDAAIKPRSNF